MRFYVETCVLLDPAKEFDVIKKYEQDKNWHKECETTLVVVFRYVSPSMEGTAQYLPAGGLIYE